MKIRSGLIPLSRIHCTRLKMLPRGTDPANTLVARCSDHNIGCSDALLRRHRSNKDRYEVATQDIASYGALLKAHEHGQQRALRVKVDAARNRLWVLGLEHVYVYDITGKQLIRRVVLPNRSVAGFVCSPDMALDRSGSAFISSNVESRLWKIDAEDFSIKQHEIRLHAGEGRDIGFGALTFAADGTLFALTAYASSLWRIDIANSSANEVELSERVLNACTLNTPRETVQGAQQHAVVLCAAAENDSRRIVISPDLTRGHVSNEKCPS